MTSTQNLIAAGTKVTTKATSIHSGQTFTTITESTVLYYDDETDTYALVSGRCSFTAPAAQVRFAR